MHFLALSPPPTKQNLPNFWALTPMFTVHGYKIYDTFFKLCMTKKCNTYKCSIRCSPYRADDHCGVSVSVDVAMKVTPCNTTDTEGDSPGVSVETEEVVDSIMMRVCQTLLCYVLPAINAFFLSGCPRSLRGG